MLVRRHHLTKERGSSRSEASSPCRAHCRKIPCAFVAPSSTSGLRWAASGRGVCATHRFSSSSSGSPAEDGGRTPAPGSSFGSTPSPDAHVSPAREVERSTLANEEVVYFIFQLDLDTQLQRALNYEAYEQASRIRAKRQRVDEALEAMRERKASNINTSRSGSGSQAGAQAPALTVVDAAVEGLRLRTAMARALEKEDYKEAAVLRDALASLEVQARRAQAMADQTSGGVLFQPRLRLGQRIVHLTHSYRGVVAGWDARCCEGEEWLDTVGPQARQRTRQPHYHVLVDQRDWEHNTLHPPVAYVAEELCWAPEMGGDLPLGAQAKALSRAASASSPAAPAAPRASLAIVASAAVEVPEGSSWSEVFGDEALAHPYMYILFLGQDAQGDYVPCRQLRSKYNVARRDVGTPPAPDEEQ